MCWFTSLAFHPWYLLYMGRARFNKLSSSVYFWKAIADLDMYVDWLVKVINHLGKIEKEQAKTKEKSLASVSRKSDIKIMVFEWFGLSFALQFSMLGICYTIVMMIIISRYPKGVSASSQTSIWEEIYLHLKFLCYPN